MKKRSLLTNTFQKFNKNRIIRAGRSTNHSFTPNILKILWTLQLLSLTSAESSPHQNHDNPKKMMTVMNMRPTISSPLVSHSATLSNVPNTIHASYHRINGNSQGIVSGANLGSIALERISLFRCGGVGESHDIGGSNDILIAKNLPKILKNLRSFSPPSSPQSTTARPNIQPNIPTSPTTITTATTKPNKEYKKIQVYLTCITIVSLWILIGTLFYSKINQWPIPQSFFYAVDAGMSIGFCTDVHETSVQSRAFTIVYILLGASCVGGALILFVQDLMNDHGIFHSSYYGEYKKLLEEDAFRRADGESRGVLNYQQFYDLWKEWTMTSYSSTNSSSGSGSYQGVKSSMLTDEQFIKVCQTLDTQKTGEIRYEDFMHMGYDGIDRLLSHHSPIGGIYSKYRWIRLLSHFWDSIASTILGEHRIYIIFTLWIALGVSWGHWNQNWDWITSLHFAVSALATGGLTAPPVNEQGILPMGPALFCGMYCLFGIPLFALTLGHFARIFIANYIASATKMAIVRPLDMAEFEFAKSLCSTDNVIHMSDFIVLQLLRQGKVSMDTVMLIKKQFNMMDLDHSGVLTLDQATQKNLDKGNK